jgi:hypothetical protein
MNEISLKECPNSVVTIVRRLKDENRKYKKKSKEEEWLRIWKDNP